MIGLKDHLGPVIGKIPTGLPDLDIAGEMARIVFGPAIEPLLPTIIGGALSIAVVASLDAMLCARIIAADARRRLDGNRDLIRLGAGNAVSPLIGGMALGINLAASFAAQRAGAKTSWSVAVHGMFVVACMALLPPIIEIMPRAVIAGMLSAVAIQLFDRWTLRLIGTLLRGEAAHRPRMLVDLGIVVLVAVIAIAVDLILAVFLGVSVAVVFFLLRMSRSVVRRSYRGDQVRSRTTRDAASSSLLAYRGTEILVLELEGALFFGTAERLAEAIERQCGSDTQFLILDLKRVQDVDSTGARVLLQVCDRFSRDARVVLLAGVPAGSALGVMLGEQGVLGAVSADRQFPDADRALEWAEDRILLEWRGARSPADFPLGQLDLLHGMEEHEVSTMRSLLRLSRFQSGEVLFRAGDSGTDLFVIVSGRASATLDLGAGREVRLITFAAGTAFGELGLLDQESRSATITADGDLICYVLGRSEYVALTQMYPGVAIKLLRNVSRELSYRLRWANRTVFELDS
jgi:CRP-like cAMP-binding protein/anti-anti-sigma regulatory factor